MSQLFHTQNRRNRVVASAATVAAATLLLAGCSSDDGAETTAPSVSAVPGDGTLVIGALLPGTGEGEEFGVATWAATQAAVNDINLAGGVAGTPVELVIVNSGSEEDTAETAFTDAGVDVVVGGFSEESRAAITALPLAAATGAGENVDPDETLLQKLQQAVPTLTDTGFATDTYDAITAIAVVAEAIGSDNGQAIIDNLTVGFAEGGFACTSFGQCADAISQNEPVAFAAASGNTVTDTGSVQIGRFVFPAGAATAVSPSPIPSS